MGRQILKMFVLAVFLITPGKSQEPAGSKVEDEMRTLEAMLKMEQKVEKMAEEIKVLKEAVSTESAISQAFRERAESEKRTAIDELINSKSAQLDAKMESLTQKTDSAVQKIDETLKSTKDWTIAFSVSFPTLHLVEGVPVFNHVITNIGDAYDVTTGVFTSPVDGVYSFLFTVASEGRAQIGCGIIQDGIFKTLGVSYVDTAYTTAAAGVNLLLKKGSRVKLSRCIHWDRAYVAGTSFSGFLIKQTSFD